MRSSEAEIRARQQDPQIRRDRRLQCDGELERPFLEILGNCVDFFVVTGDDGFGQNQVGVENAFVASIIAAFRQASS